ncbi:MAG TPA: cyclic nucleotide-binding domain-containing protein, partial [Ottowia sp.]|nr:cyclic nucleotide-binding domain-containing protein [Ottowia sp.]
MNAAPRTPPSTMDPVTPKHCSPQLRHRILSQARYFSGLSAEDLEQVNRHFRELHYPAESIICHEGGNAERLFFVARGKVKLLRHSSGGDDVLLDLLPQGALFGGLAPLGTR